MSDIAAMPRAFMVKKCRGHQQPTPVKQQHPYPEMTSSTAIATMLQSSSAAAANRQPLQSVENQLSIGTTAEKQFPVSALLPRPCPVWPLGSAYRNNATTGEFPSFPTTSGFASTPSTTSLVGLSPLRGGGGGCFRAVSGSVRCDDVRDIYRTIDGCYRLPHYSTPMIESAITSAATAAQRQLVSIMTSSTDRHRSPAMTSSSSSSAMWRGMPTRRLWSPYSDDLDELTSNGQLCCRYTLYFYIMIV